VSLALSSISLLLSLLAPGPAQGDDVLARVRQLRIQGALAEARAGAESELASGRGGSDLQVALHLELALIHDRFGLHRGTRPVAAALVHVEAASQLAARGTPLLRAQVELARAEFSYQAEMAERGFADTMRYARDALQQFRDLQDAHGEADALHKLGLVHLQRGELDAARTLFDQSRDRDRAGGERELFQADYERHVGFVLVRKGEAGAAIPYFERSLALRRRAGAVDASLFAATALATTLLDTGQATQAQPHLLYALLTAQRLDSGAGRAQACLLSARMYESLGDVAAARMAGEAALQAATASGQASVSRQAREVLERLGGAEGTAPADRR
jgi:tetratricopeptide (TPR) repeat protein